jgi:hypothetical protein
MILYVNGCSHSAGHCQPEIKTYSYIVATSLFGKNNFEVLVLTGKSSKPDLFSTFKSTISKIEKNKNYLIFNPEHGKSNDRIFFESINFLYECLTYNIHIDFSIIQWSGVNRNLSVEPLEGNHCYITDVTPHDYSDRGLKFEPFATLQTMQFMLILQDLYKKYNINYCFIPYMELDESISKNNFMYNKLDLGKFTINPNEGYRNYFRERGWVCDEQGHPSDYANYFMSIESLKILGEEDCVIGLYDYYTQNNLTYKIYDYDKLKSIKKNFNILGDATKKILDKIIVERII